MDLFHVVCVRGQQRVLGRIDERTQVQWQGKTIVYVQDETMHPIDAYSAVSMNFWGLHPDIFAALERRFHQFIYETKENPKAEFFYPPHDSGVDRHPYCKGLRVALSRQMVRCNL